MNALHGSLRRWLGSTPGIAKALLQTTRILLRCPRGSVVKTFAMPIGTHPVVRPTAWGNHKPFTDQSRVCWALRPRQHTGCRPLKMSWPMLSCERLLGIAIGSCRCVDPRLKNHRLADHRKSIRHPLQARRSMFWHALLQAGELPKLSRLSQCSVHAGSVVLSDWDSRPACRRHILPVP